MAILTLVEYKEYKGINSNTDDTKHQAIIDAVNTFIEEYCGRVFDSATYTEYFNSDDTALFPLEIPLSSVTTLKYSTDAGETYSESLVEYEDYIVDTTDDSIISLKGEFCSPTYKWNAIELVYVGGYAAIPNDLNLAAAHLVDFYRDEDYNPRKSLAGATKDTVIQPDMTARLPAHIRRVLENYRNIVL